MLTDAEHKLADVVAPDVLTTTPLKDILTEISRLDGNLQRVNETINYLKNGDK